MSEGTLIKLDGEDGLSASGMLLVRRVAEALHAHYPGHLWAVNISEDGGVLTVMNLALSGRWGFLMKLKDVQEDPSMKLVMRAGGELLERYNLSRGKLRLDEYSQVKRDWRGIPIAEG